MYVYIYIICPLSVHTQTLHPPQRRSDDEILSKMETRAKIRLCLTVVQLVDFVC